jgi:hypothetical protein
MYIYCGYTIMRRETIHTYIHTYMLRTMSPVLTFQWGRILVEILTVDQLVQKLSATYEPEGSLPYTQESVTGPYLEPD